jgi:hypothetical protein
VRALRAVGPRGAAAGLRPLRRAGGARATRGGRPAGVCVCVRMCVYLCVCIGAHARARGSRHDGPSSPSRPAQAPRRQRPPTHTHAQKLVHPVCSLWHPELLAEHDDWGQLQSLGRLDPDRQTLRCVCVCMYVCMVLCVRVIVCVCVCVCAARSTTPLHAYPLPDMTSRPSCVCAPWLGAPQVRHLQRQGRRAVCPDALPGRRPPLLRACGGEPGVCVCVFEYVCLTSMAVWAHGCKMDHVDVR